MARLDTFVKLIQDLGRNSQQDDTNPNNQVLNFTATPFDTTKLTESVLTWTASIRVWGDGTTYTAYDSNGNPYQIPSCGWEWGAGGNWSNPSNTNVKYDRYSDVVMADRPLAYYRLDDTGTTAVDFTGNGNNGFINGTPTKQSPGAVVSSVGDSSIYFNGASYVGVPEPSNSYDALNVQGNQLTLEAWISTTSGGLIMNKENSYEIQVASTVQVALMTSNMGAGNATPPNWYWFGGTKVVTDGVWHHVVVVYDGAAVTIYVDNVVDHTETPYTGNVQPETTNGFGIGARTIPQSGQGAGATAFFSGNIDEVAIYGYALSPTQVANHYNAR